MHQTIKIKIGYQYRESIFLSFLQLVKMWEQLRRVWIQAGPQGHRVTGRIKPLIASITTRPFSHNALLAHHTQKPQNTHHCGMHSNLSCRVCCLKEGHRVFNNFGLGKGRNRSQLRNWYSKWFDSTVTHSIRVSFPCAQQNAKCKNRHSAND